MSLTEHEHTSVVHEPSMKMASTASTGSNSRSKLSAYTGWASTASAKKEPPGQAWDEEKQPMDRAVKPRDLHGFHGFSWISKHRTSFYQTSKSIARSKIFPSRIEGNSTWWNHPKSYLKQHTSGNYTWGFTLRQSKLAMKVMHLHIYLEYISRFVW